MSICGHIRRFFLMSLILTGIVLSCLSVTSCQFLNLPWDHDESIGNQLGLFGYSDPYTGECTAFDDDLSSEPSENLAQKAGLAAPVMASMTLLLLMIEACWCNILCLRFVVSLFFLSAIFCQGLTFAFFNSNQFCGSRIIDEIIHQAPCSPGQGSAFSIAALVTFCFCNILLACTPKPIRNKAEKELDVSPSDLESLTGGAEEEDSDEEDSDEEEEKPSAVFT